MPRRALFSKKSSVCTLPVIEKASFKPLDIQSSEGGCYHAVRLIRYTVYGILLMEQCPVGRLCLGGTHVTEVGCVALGALTVMRMEKAGVRAHAVPLRLASTARALRRLRFVFYASAEGSKRKRNKTWLDVTAVVLLGFRRAD